MGRGLLWPLPRARGGGQNPGESLALASRPDGIDCYSSCWASRVHSWGRFSIQARIDSRVQRTVRGPTLTGLGNFPAAKSRYS